jgi:hypothetical protein
MMISWPTGRLLVSQKGICFMDLVQDCVHPMCSRWNQGISTVCSPLYSHLLCVSVTKLIRERTVVRLVRLKYGFDKIKASWEKTVENRGAGVVISVMADSCVSFVIVHNVLSTIIIIFIPLISLSTSWSFNLWSTYEIMWEWASGICSMKMKWLMQKCLFMSAKL